MIKFHTISYVRQAQGCSRSVEHESNLWRVQWFFAEFVFDPLIFTRLIYSLLPEETPYRLVWIEPIGTLFFEDCMNEKKRLKH